MTFHYCWWLHTAHGDILLYRANCIQPHFIPPLQYLGLSGPEWRNKLNKL